MSEFCDSGCNMYDTIEECPICGNGMTKKETLEPEPEGCFGSKLMRVIKLKCPKCGCDIVEREDLSIGKEARLKVLKSKYL